MVLLQANRDPDSGIDTAQVEQDAQTLFQAGELKWGTDEEKFITIFGTRSVSHLRRVFDKYMTISGFQIEETIDRETSGNLEQLLLAVVKSIRSIPAYLAETLYYAMKGAGTDDHTLIRVMVSRSEIDLYNIRKEFRKNFGTSLYSMIKDDTSGDYKKALLLLCGETTTDMLLERGILLHACHATTACLLHVQRACDTSPYTSVLRPRRVL